MVSTLADGYQRWVSPSQPGARDQVVLITGASSGIGRATARALAREGARLVLASRSRPVLEETQRECEAQGATVLVVPTDVGDSAAVDALFEEATSRFGRVDAVVHAAAVLAYGRFDEVPSEVFDRVQITNIIGTANVARSSLRVFEDQKAGHLVVIGSVLSKMVTPLLSSYATSKWAVHAMIRTIQIELRSAPGVEVSLLSPGGVDTPIYAQSGNYTGRVGRPPPPVDPPEKVAAAILDLIDDPRRERSVGLANTVMVAGFRILPGLFDAMVGPLMSRLGLSRLRVGPHSGNVFEPHPEGEAVHRRRRR